MSQTAPISENGTASITIDALAADFVFEMENVHLRLPDGTEIGTITDGRSQSVAGLASGTTTRDLMSRFEIDDPAAGQYALVVIDGDATAEIPITLP